jgi:hypothetical protein
MRGRFLSELLGRDAHSKRMKALYDVERCHRRLSSILAMSVFDPEFDDQRRALEHSLDDCCSQLRHALTYNDWWSLAEQKIKADKPSGI